MPRTRPKLALALPTAAIATPIENSHTVASPKAATKGTGFAGRFANCAGTTSVLVLDNPGLTQAISAIAEKLPELNYSPITYYDAASEQAITASGQLVTLKAQHDNLLYFEEQISPSLSQQQQQSGAVKELFEKFLAEKDLLRGVAAPGQQQKLQEKIITHEHKELAKAWLDEHDGQRTPGQAQVMGSPTSKIKKLYFEQGISQELAKLAQDQNQEQMAQASTWMQQFFNDDVKLEYSHLVGCDKLGREAQTRDNLVVTTNRCNSQQMLSEAIAKRWLEEYGQILLRVQANTIPGTEFAHTIFCSMVTVMANEQPIAMNFKFDGFSQRVPDCKELDYLRIYDVTLRNKPLTEKKYRGAFFQTAAATSQTAVVASPFDDISLPPPVL